MKLNNAAFRVYSAKIGTNAELVQGAGGNTSWKDEDNDCLWVKASGMQLADAVEKDIFVPLSLARIKALIQAEETDFSKAVLSSTLLRPSIETPLHALLSYKIVIHVHAVDVIAWAVLKNAPAILSSVLEGLNWAWIPYVQPGLPLSRAIIQYCLKESEANILILGNHGLVIGADSIEAVDNLLKAVLLRLKREPRGYQGDFAKPIEQGMMPWLDYGYKLYAGENRKIHLLAYDSAVLKLVQEKWVLYPDHAVFLGGIAPAVLPGEAPQAFFQRMKGYPSIVVLPYQGVLLKIDIKKEQEAMLVCYAEVISRIDKSDEVRSLEAEEILTLLNWDAEKYRQGLMR